MTERKKLSLNKGDAAPADQDTGGFRKPPVRGAGSAPRKRMSAAEAAQAREEAALREREREQERAREDEQRAQARPASRQGPEADRGAPRHRDAPARGDGRPAPRSGDRQGGRPDDTRDRAMAPRRDAPRRDDTHQSGARRDEPRMDRARRDEPRRDDSRRMEPRRDEPPRDEPRRDARHGRPPSARALATPAPAPREEDGRLRLSKLMSEQGLASRREADEWIEQGWVRVDGEVVDELGTRVFPHQTITIDPAARTQQAQRVTILIHKPIGYVSGQAEDGYEPAIALIRPENRWPEDKLPIQLTRGHLKNLAPAGRLDIDSTGLLVLTQDGRIAKVLIGEDSGVEKEYLVRVVSAAEPEAENVSAVTPPEAIEAMRFGLELDGRELKPAQVSWQNEQQLRVVLREGRKRQIRRMCELVGLKVVGLKRVRMGRITLGKLPQGQWRFLRPDERF